jgi:hypothetical protein
MRWCFHSQGLGGMDQPEEEDESVHFAGRRKSWLMNGCRSDAEECLSIFKFCLMELVQCLEQTDVFSGMGMQGERHIYTRSLRYLCRRGH